MKKIRLLLACLLSLAFAQPAFAASEQEAAQIRQIIQDSLDKRTMLMSGSGGGGGGVVEWEGELTVNPTQENYYGVRLPHMRIRYPDTSFLDVGVIAMNVVPEAGGMLKGSISMPTPIVFYQAGGAPAFEISIGSQKLAGVWDPQTEIFKTMDSAYKNIRISSPDGRMSGLIGEIRAVADLKTNPDDTLSGPTEAVFQDININIQSPQEGLSARLGKAVIKSGVEKLDLQKMRDFQQNMIVKANRLKDVTVGEDEKKRIADEISNAFFDYIAKVSNGFSSDVTISGLSLDTQNAQNRISVSLESGASQMSVSGLQGDRADGRLTVSLKGLESPAFPPAYADIIPREVNADIRISQLPFQKLVTALHGATTQAMQAQAQSAEMQQQQAMNQMGNMLPMILGEAGATLNVTNTYVKSPLSETRLEGTATANASAARGGTAAFLLSISGLDAVMQKLQELQKLPEHANNKSLQQAMVSLAMMQMMGQQGAGPDGKPIRSFKFEVTADGQTLINGAPALGLGGMNGGGTIRTVPETETPRPQAP